MRVLSNQRLAFVRDQIQQRLVTLIAFFGYEYATRQKDMWAGPLAEDLKQHVKADLSALKNPQQEQKK